MPPQTIGSLKQLGRAFRLITHLTKGILLVWIVFPRIQAIQRDTIIVGWSQEMLGILNARLRMLGHVPPASVSSVLFAANHISWLDILAINAVRRVRFVAKAEVRQWPIIGWLAAKTGTIFLRRSRDKEITRLVGTIERSLRKGHCVGLFPEGTTTNGASVEPFHPGLFESAITTESTVWPVGIRYLRPNGTPDIEAAFIGEDSLLRSIFRITAQPATDIHLWFAPPLVGTGTSRRELAQQAHTAIAEWVERHDHRSDSSIMLRNIMNDQSIPPLSAA